MNIAFIMEPGAYLIVPPEYAPALTEILVNSTVAHRTEENTYIETLDTKYFPSVELIRNQDVINVNTAKWEEVK